jgi:hypothetical protein
MVFHRNGKFLILPNHLESRKVDAFPACTVLFQAIQPPRMNAYLAALICATMASSAPFLMVITPLGSIKYSVGKLRRL